MTDETWKWFCGLLVSANVAQYARDWMRERRVQKVVAEKDAELREAQALHRADLMTMMPALTRVLDWVRS